MITPKPDKAHELPLVQLVPNVLTILAICAGLTAIRFGYQGDFENAVGLILIAAVLDGLDGRVARLLKCQSPIGAELDSLADFINFGVAPGLLIHAWALQDFSNAGWIAVLGYATCCVLRLARFNVSNAQDKSAASNTFFIGIPSPAGALLVMLPMYASFAFSHEPLLPDAVLALYLLVIGLLMISRFPTYSFKKMSISRTNVKFWMLACALLVTALFMFLWTTMVVICAIYLFGLIWARWSRLGRDTDT